MADLIIGSACFWLGALVGIMFLAFMSAAKDQEGR